MRAWVRPSGRDRNRFAAPIAAAIAAATPHPRPHPQAHAAAGTAAEVARRRGIRSRHGAVLLHSPGGDRFEPTEATVGPWSAQHMHGGPPSALLVHRSEQLRPRHGAGHRPGVPRAPSWTSSGRCPSVTSRSAREVVRAGRSARPGGRRAARRAAARPCARAPGSCARRTSPEPPRPRAHRARGLAGERRAVRGVDVRLRPAPAVATGGRRDGRAGARLAPGRTARSRWWTTSR